MFLAELRDGRIRFPSHPPPGLRMQTRLHQIVTRGSVRVRFREVFGDPSQPARHMWCTAEEVTGADTCPAPYGFGRDDSVRQAVRACAATGPWLAPTMLGSGNARTAIVGYHGTGGASFHKIVGGSALRPSREGMLGPVRHLGTPDKAARFAHFPTYYARNSAVVRQETGGMLRYMVPVANKRLLVVGAGGFGRDCACRACARSTKAQPQRRYVDHDGAWRSMASACVLLPTTRWTSRGGTRRPEVGLRDDVEIALLDGALMDDSRKTARYDPEARYPVDSGSVMAPAGLFVFVAAGSGSGGGEDTDDDGRGSGSAT